MLIRHLNILTLPKYRFIPYEKSSLSHYSQKLSEKNQSVENIEEAYQAILLLLPYYQSGLKTGELKNSVDVIQQLIGIIRQKNYSSRTLEAYSKWCRSFLYFYDGEPINICDADARKYLNYLVTERKCSPSAHNQAFNSLLFLFRHVIKKDFGNHSGNVRAKRPGKKIPVVLSKNEIKILFKAIPKEYLLHFQLMYGCGLRLAELISLRLKDIDFENQTVIINESKGLKSRTTVLPQKIINQLKKI